MSDGKNALVKSIHKVIINNRESISISGIKEIVDFDENEVNLRSNCGDISIDGENLHINVLNIASGEIELVGKISGIFYSSVNDNDKRSLLSKIFK